MSETSKIVTATFAADMGMEIVEAGDGTAAVRMVVREEHLNPAGAAHGAALAALVDMTLSFAVGAHTDPAKRRFSLTLSLTTNFLAAAKPGPITCRAWTTGGGRKTVFCDGDIRDDADRLIATATGTFKLIDFPEGNG